MKGDKAMINWKLRLKNKTTLLALSVTVIAFVYQILGLFGVVPAVTEETVTQLVTMLINILAMLGIVVDPTTAGISDSNRAMEYENPYLEGDEINGL